MHFKMQTSNMDGGESIVSLAKKIGVAFSFSQ